MNKSTTEDIAEMLENPIAAFLASFASMVIVGTILPTYWIFLFSVALSYLISDLVINGFIIGGKGIAQIPLIKKGQTQHKGHTYIAFFIGIVISTIVGSIISELILELIKSSADWLTWVLGWSFIICIAIFVDLEARFYKRK